MAGMATVPTVAEHVHRDEDGVAYFCWMIQGLREAFASEQPFGHQCVELTWCDFARGLRDQAH